MHQWGDENVAWAGIEDTAYEIGNFISKWGRINVHQCKEKFGTVRVYCSFGFSCFHSLIWPRHMWIHKWWPYRLDLRVSNKLSFAINKYLIPFQEWVYKVAYKRVIQKRPHLYKEILSDANGGELFNGYIPGYKHSDFWTEVK